MRRYRCIRAGRATYPTAMLCRVLRVSRSGDYAWAHCGVSARAQADEDLAAQIAAELRARGLRCAHKRVVRLMRAAGLVGCQRRRRIRATVAAPARPSAPNLVAREFTASAPNRLWVGDITFVPTLSLPRAARSGNRARGRPAPPGGRPAG